jgi:hypothetical protein
MKNCGQSTTDLAVENSGGDWKNDFPVQYKQQMQPGRLAEGWAAVYKPDQQPAWQELSELVARNGRGFTEFLDENDATNIPFYYGVLLVWASPNEDVECESNLPLALGNAVKNAKVQMTAHGSNISNGVVIVCTVLNPKIMGVSLEDNKRRNIELLTKAYPQMISVLESNPYPKRREILFQTLELNNAHSDEESNEVYHLLFAWVRDTNAKNRPAEIMTTTRKVEKLPDGTNCLVTSCVPEKAPDHRALCSYPDCPNMQGKQMTYKQVCGICKSVHYCDKNCQKMHKAHKLVCRKMLQGRLAVKGGPKPELRPDAQLPTGTTTIQISMPPGIMEMVEAWDEDNRSQQNTDDEEEGGLNGLD